jgi:putative transposase
MVLKPGIEVRVGNQHYRIRQILDLETVLVEDSQDGQTRRFKINELEPLMTPSETPSPMGQVELAQISDAAWQVAQQRFSVLRPLLSSPRCTIAEVEAGARTAGVNIVTVYPERLV